MTQRYRTAGTAHSVRLYRFRLSASLTSAVAPVVHAATAEAASGCVTHTSITTGRPGKDASKSPRWGPRWLCGRSRGACCIGRGGGGCGCCCRCCAGRFCDAVRGSEDCAVTGGVRREGEIGLGRIGVSLGAMGGWRHGRGAGQHMFVNIEHSRFS